MVPLDSAPAFHLDLRLECILNLSSLLEYPGDREAWLCQQCYLLAAAIPNFTISCLSYLWNYFLLTKSFVWLLFHCRRQFPAVIIAMKLHFLLCWAFSLFWQPPYFISQLLLAISFAIFIKAAIIAIAAYLTAFPASLNLALNFQTFLIHSKTIPDYQSTFFIIIIMRK